MQLAHSNCAPVVIIDKSSIFCICTIYIYVFIDMIRHKLLIWFLCVLSAADMGRVQHTDLFWSQTPHMECMPSVLYTKGSDDIYIYTSIYTRICK